MTIAAHYRGNIHNNLQPPGRVNAIRDLHSELEEILHCFTQLGVAMRLRIVTVAAGRLT